jgi:hypothetical protein
VRIIPSLLQGWDTRSFKTDPSEYEGSDDWMGWAIHCKQCPVSAHIVGAGPAPSRLMVHIPGVQEYESRGVRDKPLSRFK